MERIMGPPLLAIEGLHVSYSTREGDVPAVVDCSLRVQQGECVGLVGESGCGKTTVALAIMRYLGANGRTVGGRMVFKGRDLLLLDEPTTALDVTIAAGITELIKEVRHRFGTSMLYISHDLGRIMEVCDRVYVMYAGQIVESGLTSQVFNAPRHPYTRGLLRALPLPETQKHTRPLRAMRGQPPGLNQRPVGCVFGPRCEAFQPGLCDAGQLPLYDVGDAPVVHHVRCARWQDIETVDTTSEASPPAPMELGEDILRVEALRKYY